MVNWGGEARYRSVGQVHLVLTERMKRKISERVKMKGIPLNNMKISYYKEAFKSN